MGYVGRDVEQIIRDLIEIAIAMEKEKEEKRLIKTTGSRRKSFRCTCRKASLATRESFRKRLRSGIR